MFEAFPVRINFLYALPGVDIWNEKLKKLGIKIANGGNNEFYAFLGKIQH